MPTEPNIFDDSPALDGPDYVALVIEWDELADDLERQLRGEPGSLEAPEVVPQRRWLRRFAIAASVVGAGALTWGIIHRLRA